MALYKGNVKLAGVGKSFSPENCGCNGQVLTKTSTGYAYCDNEGFSPENEGEEGQVLTKTATGYNYQDLPIKLSTQSNNALASGAKLRAGTQAQYTALGSYDSSTIYLTY